MRSLLTLILLLSLTSCGFHLRGSVQLPPELTEMAVRDASPATLIAADLRRALGERGVRVFDTASMVLQLHGEAAGKRVLSVSREGKAQEYGLSYTVRFSVRDAAGALWLAEQAVTTSRDLRFDANAVLGTGSEEAQLREEMRRDAVTQILRRLQHARAPAVEAAPDAKPVTEPEAPLETEPKVTP
jgi:LPS-assembly lipoprotein